MGAGASTGHGSKGAGAPSKVSGASTPASAPAPTFACQPRHNLDDCPSHILVRVSPEALTLLDTSEKALRSYPYHRIMCWGHNSEIFKFRTFLQPSADSEPTSTGDSAEGSADAGAAATRAADLVNIVVSTKQGQKLEAAIMSAVKKLMGQMEAAGMHASEFDQLCTRMTEESDTAIATLRQVALSRSFDIKQATRVVQLVGEVSPFDRVEAAILMFDSLINTDSFPLVLDTFEDAVDRDNICHRLEISLDDAGRIQYLGKRKKRQAKKRRQEQAKAEAAAASGAAQGAASTGAGGAGAGTAAGPA